MLKYGPTSYIYYPHVERKNVVVNTSGHI